jgi:hypothetical protein
VADSGNEDERRTEHVVVHEQFIRKFESITTQFARPAEPLSRDRHVTPALQDPPVEIVHNERYFLIDKSGVDITSSNKDNKTQFGDPVPVFEKKKKLSQNKKHAIKK